MLIEVFSKSNRILIKVYMNLQLAIYLPYTLTTHMISYQFHKG